MSKKKHTTKGDLGQAKILYFDIETAPNLSYVWAQWEQNVLAHEREWYMLCFSYLWEGDTTTRVVAQTDFPSFKKDRFDDTGVIKKLWKLLDEADVVIGHNLDKFDVRKANARFIQAGLGAPTPYLTIDTLKLARRYFMFNSNRLGDLCELLGIGHKHETGGFGLWQGCMDGDEKSWRKMKRYAKQDTALLPFIYKALRPWMKNHPSINLIGMRPDSCPTCGASGSLQRRGNRFTKTGAYVQYKCGECGSYCRERKADQDYDKPSLVS